MVTSSSIRQTVGRRVTTMCVTWKATYTSTTNSRALDSLCPNWASGSPSLWTADALNTKMGLSMKNSAEVFNELNSPKVKNGRTTLKTYLQEAVAYQQQHPDEAHETAYRLAGLMATDFVTKLSEDDPYVEILALAGEFELPERHHSGAGWEKLRKRVNAL